MSWLIFPFCQSYSSSWMTIADFLLVLTLNSLVSMSGWVDFSCPVSHILSCFHFLQLIWCPSNRTLLLFLVVILPFMIFMMRNIIIIPVRHRQDILKQYCNVSYVTSFWLRIKDNWYLIIIQLFYGCFLEKKAKVKVEKGRQNILIDCKISAKFSF